MADKVHLLQSVLGPEVNVEDVHCMLYLVAIDLLPGLCVFDYESHTGRRCDGPPVLVTEATHPRTLRLLHNIQGVYPALVILGRVRLEVQLLLAFLLRSEGGAFLGLRRGRLGSVGGGLA